MVQDIPDVHFDAIEDAIKDIGNTKFLTLCEAGTDKADDRSDASLRSFDSWTPHIQQPTERKLCPSPPSVLFLQHFQGIANGSAVSRETKQDQKDDTQDTGQCLLIGNKGPFFLSHEPLFQKRN